MSGSVMAKVTPISSEACYFSRSKDDASGALGLTVPYSMQLLADAAIE